MKNVMLALAVLALVSCELNLNIKDHSGTLMPYDSLKAATYGADDYGMKPYTLGFLYAGPNLNQSAEEAQKIQAGHMQHLTTMADSGVLVLAGPMLSGDSLKGLLFLDADSTEAAEWASADPAVQSGRLSLVLKPWYGSAALMEINSIHKTLQKKGISE